MRVSSRFTVSFELSSGAAVLNTAILRRSQDRQIVRGEVRAVPRDDAVGFRLERGKELNGVLEILLREIDCHSEDGRVKRHDGEDVQNVPDALDRGSRGKALPHDVMNVVQADGGDQPQRFPRFAVVPDAYGVRVFLP